ncbi:type II toxin-antitoxin system HipA family toxin [bacterium]|nr:type II toxin-antitoxin system HipA family toxin [bacterium]
MNPDAIEVCIDWQGHAFPVGTLYAAVASESVVFEYQPEWLSRVGAFAVDPVALPLAPGRFHAVRLFGAFADAGPDRWGRMLIERAVRQGMLDRRPYRAVDFLLAVDDVARIGAIRFRRAGERAFLGSGNGVIPPLVRLRELLAATDAVHDEKATARDLRFLLGAGSPLGGARPKCLVTLPDGRLAIAKFPKPDDTRDIAAGEVLGLAVGRAAGIKTADHQLARIGGRSVAIITRFDRRQEGRIPFLSAVSLLGLLADDAGSYTRLADGIRAHGDQVAADLEQLWRRVVYSIMANNYDDHMRNHGFVMHSAGVWALSPAYDINPTPAIDRARQPKTPVSDEAHAPADALEAIEAAVASADRFGLKPEAARRIVAEVRSAVSTWRTIGKRLGIASGTLAAYADAFEA